MVLPLLAALAGCASSPSANYIAQADVTDSLPTSATMRSARGIDPSLVLAQMPEPGGTVTDIHEQTFANGMRQEITLGGSVPSFGPNRLIVAVQSTAPAAGGKNVPLWRPGEAGIKQEIIARYPQLDMQILTQPRRNALGPFGLAIGRNANGVRCVFAWQWVDDINNTSGGAFSRFGGLGDAGQPATIRVHLCRKDATVDDLAMAVEGLTLAPKIAMDRIFDPGRRATIAGPTVPAVAGGGMAVASASDGTLESALSTPTRQKRVVADAPRRTRVAHRTRRKAEPAAEDMSAGVAPTAQPAAPVYQSGPRYMAPVGGGMAQAGVAQAAPYVASPYGMTAAPQTKALDPSLPAAAYRGPNGGR